MERIERPYTLDSYDCVNNKFVSLFSYDIEIIFKSYLL